MFRRKITKRFNSILSTTYNVIVKRDRTGMSFRTTDLISLTRSVYNFSGSAAIMFTFFNNYYTIHDYKFHAN